MGEQGGPPELNRQLIFEKKREKMYQEIQKKKEEIIKENQIRIGNDKFVTQNDYVENELKTQTIGLVQLEDFQRIKDELQKQQALSKMKPEKKERKTKIQASKLSFLDNDDDFEQEDIQDRKKLKKNPNVDTSFLPDKEREEEEERLKLELQEKWIKDQEKLKQETITVSYSYWNGSGHFMEVECQTGDTIAQFLEKCKTQWKELKGVPVDNLIYVKEDIIIPHHYTFYEFIINKTRGKTGPLFMFNVKDDIRLQSDATIETEESHAGKVIERSWYERNKHIYPASRWEIFDPQKDYGKYSLIS